MPPCRFMRCVFPKLLDQRRTLRAACNDSDRAIIGAHCDKDYGNWQDIGRLGGSGGCNLLSIALLAKICESLAAVYNVVFQFLRFLVKLLTHAQYLYLPNNADRHVIRHWLDRAGGLDFWRVGRRYV